MGRMTLIRDEKWCYHVRGRVKGGEFFPAPRAVVWQRALELLGECYRRFGIEVHAFVVMGNHFHLLVRTPTGNLDQVMHFFMRELALAIGGAGGLWEGRYKWSLINHISYYYQVYRYVLQNPLRAGLVKRVEEYPFSTLFEAPPFPLMSRVALDLGGEAAHLIWLNDPLSFEAALLVKRGLRHWEFSVNQKRLRLFESLRSPGLVKFDKN